MPKREGNNPKRRIAAGDFFSLREVAAMRICARYGGFANHKRRPGDYQFHPPTNPRPNKSLFDGLRTVPRDEASAMLTRGIELCMVSTAMIGVLPKFVWSVDSEGEPYEAKVGEDGRTYRGYRLGDDERAMRDWVLEEWAVRCRT